MCCWQRTSALPPWALSQQAGELWVGLARREKAFVRGYGGRGPHPGTPCLLGHLIISRGLLWAPKINPIPRLQGYFLVLISFSDFPFSHLHHRPPCLLLPLSSPSTNSPGGLNFSCLCCLHVFSYESRPLKANTSQTVTHCTWQLLSGLLISHWEGKCKENVKTECFNIYDIVQYGLCLMVEAISIDACVCIGNQESHLPQQISPGDCWSRCAVITSMICTCRRHRCTWLICCATSLCRDSFVCFCCVMTRWIVARSEQGSEFTDAGGDDGFWKHRCCFSPCFSLHSLFSGTTFLLCSFC